MDKEAQIRKLQQDGEQLLIIKRNLIMEGHGYDSPEVLMVEERMWYLAFRIYVLTAGEAAGAKLLSELGIHQN